MENSFVNSSVAVRQVPCRDNLITRLGSGVAYYGYRYYDPMTGRWPSRDPLAEEAFIQRFVEGKFVDLESEDAQKEISELRDETRKNIFAFVDNNPVSKTDTLGLFDYNNDPLTCAGAIHDTVKHFEDVRSGKISDDFGHCIAHCKLLKRCGPGAFVAGGPAKEVLDRIFGGGSDRWDDLKANAAGACCGLKTAAPIINVFYNCYDCCKK